MRLSIFLLRSSAKWTIKSDHGFKLSKIIRHSYNKMQALTSFPSFDCCADSPKYLICQESSTFGLQIGTKGLVSGISLHLGAGCQVTLTCNTSQRGQAGLVAQHRMCSSCHNLHHQQCSAQHSKAKILMLTLPTRAASRCPTLMQPDMWVYA